MNAIKVKKPSKLIKTRYNQTHSSGPKKRKFTYSAQQITDLIATPISVDIKGYGVNNLYWVYGQKHNDYNTATATGTVINSTTSGGVVKSIGCLPGRQAYFEDCALMYSQPAATGTVGQPVGWTMTVLDMVKKAQNEGHAFNPFSSQPDFTASSTFDQASSLQFIYHGGFLEHKFTNTLNTTAYLEFREFTPRQILPHMTIGSSVWKIDGLYRTLKYDLENQQGGVTYPSTDSSSYDNYDDKAFKYNGKCIYTNSHWVVGKAVVVKVMPGETYTYKMILPPFTFKSSEMMSILNAQTSALGSHAFPGYIPQFTKHFVMRAWGESGAFSASDYINDANATSNEPTDPMPDNIFNTSEFIPQQLDKVCTSSVRLAHVRREHHTFRATIYNQYKVLKIVRNYTDFGNAKYVPGTDQAVYTMDEDGDGQLPDLFNTQSTTNNGAVTISLNT